MTQGHLTNSQFFQKHRFAEFNPPSDFEVVCHGKLIQSSRQPETFYNGWYPVRHQCSFPDHKPPPGAGLRSEKGLQFRNYRIICDICDHPDNKLDPIKEKSVWSPKAPCRNSVAPRMDVPDVCPQPTLPNVKQETAKRCGQKVDAYWRYHDPHYVASTDGLPQEGRVHDSNWFKQQMYSENKYKSEKQAYQTCQRQLHLVKKYSNPADQSQLNCCQQLAKHSTAASPQLSTNVAETLKPIVLPDRLSQSTISQKTADV